MDESNVLLKKNINFSIIIPVYNAENFIKKCVDSALNQGNKINYEIILVNDGSTDRSYSLCLEFQEKFSCIKVINQKNQGVSAARNEGVKSAKGEYILFLDSDDWLEPDALENIYANYLIDRQLDILVIWANIVRQNGNITGVLKGVAEYTASPFSGEEYIVNKGITWNNVVWQYIFSRKYLVENNFWFREKIYHEDNEFLARVFPKAKKICVCEKVFYNYYMADNVSIMRSPNRKRCQDLIQIAEEIRRYINIQPYNKKVKDKYKIYISYLSCQSIVALVIQGFDLTEFLNENNNRERILKSIEGFNKYFFIKVLLKGKYDKLIQKIIVCRRMLKGGVK